MTTVQELFSLKNKVAILTGGSGYLANQQSEALAEAGANVVLMDNQNLEIAKKRAKNLTQRFQKAIALKADIIDKLSVQKTIKTAIEEFGHIDILINNAGKTYFKLPEDLTEQEWDEIVSIHLKGTFLCIQACLSCMKKQKSGKIINIGSIYGIVGADQRIYGKSKLNSSAVYAASKGGIINLTRYFAAYLGKYNINVNCISPGGFFNKHKDKYFLKQYCYRTPLGRMGNQTDLKGAIVFLASAASDWITGHNLVVDGGWTAW